MKIKEKDMNYFCEYRWKKVFMKSASVIAAACFVFSIINLPVYAKPLYKGQGQTANGIYLNTDGSAYRSPAGMLDEAAMDSIEEDNGALKQNGEIVGSVVNGVVSVSCGSSGMKENDYYTRLLNDKIMKYAEEAGLVVKAADGKGGYRRLADSENFDGLVKSVSRNAKISKEEIKRAIGELRPDREDIGIGKLALLTVGSAAKWITQPAAIFKSKEKERQYDYVVDKLADPAQAGISREDAEEALQALDEKDRDNAVGILADFFAAGGSIINCAADALAAALDMSSKGLFAFQALLAEIIAGNFSSDNIAAGEDGGAPQLMTSMSALQEILGDDFSGYQISGEEGLAGVLNKGANGSVILNVSSSGTGEADHYVTAIRTEDGNINLYDINKEIQTFESTKELYEYLQTEYGWDKDGKGGAILTDGAADGIGLRLTREEMQNIKGAVVTDTDKKNLTSEGQKELAKYTKDYEDAKARGNKEDMDKASAGGASVRADPKYNKSGQGYYAGHDGAQAPISVSAGSSNNSGSANTGYLSSLYNVMQSNGASQGRLDAVNNIAETQRAALGYSGSVLYEDNEELFESFKTNNTVVMPGSANGEASYELFKQSVNFSNSEKAKGIVNAVISQLEDSGFIFEQKPEVLFVYDTIAGRTGSAVSHVDYNLIVIPIEQFPADVMKKDGLWMFTDTNLSSTIAHEYTHIKNTPEVRTGEMPKLEDEMLATLAGEKFKPVGGAVIIVEENGKEVTLNADSGLRVVAFQTALDNKKQIERDFKESNPDVKFNDIYYTAVPTYMPKEEYNKLPEIQRELFNPNLKENEIGLSLYYDNTTIIYAVNYRTNEIRTIP
ncbi:MAG: hypothetical protein FWH43_06155 [Endomicrobia bacterium]|nr:hypothetical protein [Endomicrobiia bacterium]